MRRWKVLPLALLLIGAPLTCKPNGEKGAQARTEAPPPVCPKTIKSKSKQPVHGLSVVLDRSGSTRTAGTSRCDELGARIEQQLANLPPHEDLLLFATIVGDGVAPIVLANGERLSDRDAPLPKAAIYAGPDETLQKRHDAESGYRAWAVECMVNRCGSAPQASGVPIYAAVEAALVALDKACQAASCASQTLAVHSDLRDSSVFTVATKGRAQMLTSEVGRTKLLACGTRQTVGGSLVEADRVEKRWTGLLGPTLEISPLCPGPVQLPPRGKAG